MVHQSWTGCIDVGSVSFCVFYKWMWPMLISSFGMLSERVSCCSHVRYTGKSLTVSATRGHLGQRTRAVVRCKCIRVVFPVKEVNIEVSKAAHLDGTLYQYHPCLARTPLDGHFHNTCWQVVAVALDLALPCSLQRSCRGLHIEPHLSAYSIGCAAFNQGHFAA